MAQQVDFARIDEDVVTRACQVLDLLCRRGMSVVTAESCTGALIATLLSEAPGANEHLQGGFVVYTKPNKTAALGVPADVLAREGAVCRTVVCAMAAPSVCNALRRVGAHASRHMRRLCRADSL